MTKPSIYTNVDSPVVRRMLKRFDIAVDAEDLNRRRGLNALKFSQGGENQWEKGLLDLRGLDNRPCESFNQIPNFIHQVTNDMRMNMAQTRFIPNGDANKKTAEVMEDLVRNIQTQSDAEIAYDTAAYAQCVSGWGYWRYITEYEAPSDLKNPNQIIKVRWVPNAFNIYDDPFASQQDRLDRKWLIETCDMPVNDFNDEYDREYSEGDLQSIGDSSPDWCTKTTVRVAEYWELKETKRIVYINKKTKETAEEKPSDLNNYDSRPVIDTKVMWYKCTATEILESAEWVGNYIPYVRVVGEEVNIDGKSIVTGLVERMIPAQRQMNYWKNSATELMALAPVSPFIADPAAIGPWKDVWDKANVRNYPFLPHMTYDEQGRQLNAPQRLQNSADIGAVMQMVQQAQQDFYNTSGIYPASLGQASNEKSGKAILARQREGDTSTFHYPDNMARAQRAGGRILADLIPKIYDGARTIQTTKENRTSKAVMINQPFYDEETGENIVHDLTMGVYDVAVSTGPNFATKRQEAAESQIQMLQTPLGAIIAQTSPDIVIANQDWEGADKIAERVKRGLPPQFQDQKANEVPPQIQAQMQQMQQVIQQLGGELQQAQQELQSKQADLALKAQDIQSSAQSDQMKAENDRMKLAIDAKKLELEEQKIAIEAYKARTEASNRNAVNPQEQQSQEVTTLGLGRDALEAQIMHLDRMSMEDQMRSQQQQEEQMQQALLAQQQQEMQMQMLIQEKAEEAMRAKQLQDGVTGVQVMLAQLVQSINAPKQVVRNPKTGLIEGVVTQ